MIAIADLASTFENAARARDRNTMRACLPLIADGISKGSIPYTEAETWRRIGNDLVALAGDPEPLPRDLAADLGLGPDATYATGTVAVLERICKAATATVAQLNALAALDPAAPVN